MARIYAPNKEYNGVTASIPFIKGIGETDNPHLIKWFKQHGYKVEDEKKPEDKKNNVDTQELKDMTVEQLKAYAEENNIDIGNATSKEGIMKKIEAAE